MNPSAHNTFEDFSCLDSIQGFNEVLQPDVELIIEIFKLFVGTKAQEIDDFLDAVPIPPVLSMDHTFNVMKRTIDYNSEFKEYVAVENTALHVIMGGAGEVLTYSECVGTQASFVKRDL